MINGEINTQKCALIIGHPGHELRVYGWLRKTRPVIAILTDGSGHHDISRIELTKKLLGNQSGLYGLYTDREIYKAILNQDIAFFFALADKLTDWLVEKNIEFVAGDSIEGYNPTHDMCRLLIDRATYMASCKLGRLIQNYSYPLMGPPRLTTIPANLCFKLDSETLSEKLTETRNYAQSAGGILVTEVEELLQNFGESSFGEELFYSISSQEQLDFFENQKPFYEVHGEKQVAAGHYKFVIRYKEHVAPIAKSLQYP